MPTIILVPELVTKAIDDMEKMSIEASDGELLYNKDKSLDEDISSLEDEFLFGVGPQLKIIHEILGGDVVDVLLALEMIWMIFRLMAKELISLVTFSENAKFKYPTECGEGTKLVQMIKNYGRTQIHVQVERDLMKYQVMVEQRDE